MKTATVYVPGDAAARAVGADEVAEAFLAAGLQVIRNGSRGMCWLEPLVERETEAGRLAFGPVTAEDVPGLLADFSEHHPLCLGLTSELPWMKGQKRLTFGRVGLIDPLSLQDYEQHGGWSGLKRAFTLSGAEIVQEVLTSGLRGRGGAAFPAGIKWRTVLNTASDQKYICCNADEGDSGTFADRMLMEGDPYLLIEGMLIAGFAVGASRGFIYLRSEYPDAERIFLEAIRRAEAAGFLGNRVMGSDFAFHLELRRGAGAYICGEETAMLESLEGKRGMVRPKPPLPAIAGLFGKPTLIHNVLSLAAIPTILEKGGAFYAEFGMGRSRGTLAFQLAGNIQRGGLLEVPFGLTLRQLVEEFGGGTASGRPVRAVQVGGPLGPYLPAEKLDTPLDYEAFTSVGGMIGHGGIVVFDDTVDMAAMARYAMEFCANESCGKCTPCRIGSVRGVEVIDRIVMGERREENLVLLRDLCDTMESASLCAMGGMTPLPVLSALQHFSQDFGGSPHVLDQRN